MTEPSYDYAIIGQGLAGTLLAWRLHDRGRRVVLIDRNEPVTASKVAAGLVNPITGQRISLSWRLAEFLPEAEKFYRSREDRLGSRFFYPVPIVRQLQSQDALRQWKKTAAAPEVRACLSDPQPSPLVDSDRVHPGAGGFETSTSYILDVPALLSASKAFFGVREADLDCANAIIPGSRSVKIRLPEGTLTASRLIFCQGPDARSGNPYFDWVPFHCAKGEILNIRCPELEDERRILVGSAWLAPTPGSAPGIFRAGSTYAHNELTNLPTNAGRDAIEKKIRDLLKVGFEVTGHLAAVRPIINRSRALIGIHPTHGRIGFFNGLGSKGSLNGPAIAEKFAAHLEEGAPIEADFDLLKNF